MSADDEGDVRKARAILIVFATIIYLALYFQINLESLSLSGLALKPRANQEDIWFAVALLNFYFWLRYIQHLPEELRHFDQSMDAMFDRTLFQLVNIFYLSMIKKNARTQLRDQQKLNYVVMNTKPHDYHMTYLDILEEQDRQGEGASPLYKLALKYRTNIKVSIAYHRPDAELLNFWSSQVVEVSPHLLVVYFCFVCTFFKGAFLKPWVSTVLLPLIYGYVSIMLSLSAWIRINNYF